MMRKFFKVLRQFRRSFVGMMKDHKLYRNAAILSAILVFLTFLLPLWKILPLAGEQGFIPLHYNIYFGIDRFGPWYFAFVPPMLGLTLLLINLIFQATFYRREKILSHFFAVATVFAEALLFVAMVLIILLNL